MNLKIWLPFAAALVAGTAAAWAGYSLVTQRPPIEQDSQVKLETMVIAARSMAAGSQITAGDLTTLRVERGTAPAGSMASTSDLVGRITVDHVAAGQPLVPSLVSSDPSAAGLAATLPEGFRAITVEIDPYNGLDGFLRPEARVDVIASVGSGEDAAALAVAQNIRVIAVSGRLRGQSLQKTGEEQASLANRYNVTLMVSPEQAAAIELACSFGRPRLMLRPGGDDAIADFAGMTVAQLRGHRPAEQADPDWDAQPIISDPATRPADPVERPPAPRRAHVIEVIRGGEVSRVELPLPHGQQKRRQADREVVNNDARPAMQ